METNSRKYRALAHYLFLAQTKDCIKRICEKIQKNPQHSANKIAVEENVSHRTVQLILNEDQGFCLYQKRKVQGLTKSQRIKMVQRYEKLIIRHNKKSIDIMIFSDEKIFCTEQSFYTKNDIVYSTIFEDIPENFGTVKHFQNKSSVMILETVTSN